MSLPPGCFGYDHLVVVAYTADATFRGEWHSSIYVVVDAALRRDTLVGDTTLNHNFAAWNLVTSRTFSAAMEKVTIDHFHFSNLNEKSYHEDSH